MSNLCAVSGVIFNAQSQHFFFIFKKNFRFFLIFSFCDLVCSFFGEVFGSAFGVAFVAGRNPVVDVHWVDASVDFNDVVDGCCFGSFAPVADVVVLQEFCPGCAIGRVVKVFAPMVSHG